jgi:hypothetical protein
VTAVTVRKRPRPLGALVAVLALTAAVATIGTEQVVTFGLAAQVAALAVAWLGFDRLRDGHRLTGLPVATVGAAAAVGIPGVVAVLLGNPQAFLDVLPAMFGVFLLGMGVTAFATGGSRWLVKLGAGLVFLAALVSVLLHETAFGPLLWVVALTVVAWDAGETAINVGGQLGRAATAWSVQGTHLLGTVVVAVGGVYLTRTVEGISAGGMSLERLVVLVVAVVFLAAALHD